jgi:hypothetical protein
MDAVEATSVPGQPTAEEIEAQRKWREEASTRALATAGGDVESR